MKKKLLLAICLMASVASYGQTVEFDAAAKKMTITGLTAGSLETVLSAKETEVEKNLRVREDDNDADSAPIQTLTITGQLNGDDIKIIANMARFWIDNGDPTTIYKHGGLKHLDISGAQIVSGGGYYIDENITGNVGDGGWAYKGFVPGIHQYNTQDNIIGKMMFFGCNNLKSIKIPSTTTKISTYAFACLSSLSEILIPASVERIETKAFWQSFDLYSAMDNLGAPVTIIRFEGDENKVLLDENALTQYTSTNFMAEIESPVSLLGDYAVDEVIRENVEAGFVKAQATPPNKYWTFSCGVDIVLPENIKAYTCRIVNGETDIVELTNAQLDADEDGKRVIPANNGVLLACPDNAESNAYDMVVQYNAGITAIATEDAKTWGDQNALVPVIRKAHYNPGDYYMLYHGKWVVLASDAEQVPAGKALLKK